MSQKNNSSVLSLFVFTMLIAGSGLLPEKFLGGTKRMKKIIALLLALMFFSRA